MKSANELIPTYILRAEEKLVGDKKKKAILERLFEEFDSKISEELLTSNGARAIYNANYLGFSVKLDDSGELKVKKCIFEKPLKYGKMPRYSSVLQTFFDENIRRYLERRGYLLGFLDYDYVIYSNINHF